MSEPQFTPGPWTYRQSIETVSCASYPIAKIKVPRTGDELRANGHLIAAAPDLYAALVDAIGIMPPEACGPALAALAKARGDAGKFTRGGEPG